MITAFVNKREKGNLSPRSGAICIEHFSELTSALEGMLEMIWVKEVVDTTHPFDVRRRGLLVYVHVSLSSPRQ